ncbi:MAG: adenylate/guanylate cyclase domain-containing protein [Myxococcota bacterium]
MPIKILFVDDEPDLEVLIRQKLRREIRKGEVDLEFAGDGIEAMAKIEAREQDFDLVITDINMPRMNGLELLAALQEIEMSTLVIVLSAYGDMANIRTAMNSGAFDFLTKPLDFIDLQVTRDKAMRHLGSLRERARLQQEKERLEQRGRFVRETFGRYLNDSVVQTLLDAPDGLRMGGEKREISILMSDLRSFTSMCERLDPEEVVSTLNLYFGAMTDIVFEHGGTIDELIGDAMLVIFGAPLDQDDHAERAVRCAVAMQQAMDEVNRQNAERGLPALQMGIGIDTGEAVVGNIGSLKRSKYGVVGSHVNLAARIEALTVGGQVLVSADTRRACAAELDIAQSLQVEAKGFGEPVTVHDLRGLIGGPTLPPRGAQPPRAPTQAPLAEAVVDAVASDPEVASSPAASADTTPPAEDTQNHLATIGLMIAGVAHDIRNPLGFIVNFADMSSELADEVVAEVKGRLEGEVAEDVEASLADIQGNLGKIREHGTRATDLVRTMVETLRGTRGRPQDIDLNANIARHLDLFETSMRAARSNVELVVERELDDAAGKLRIAPQDLSRILVNLVQNACDAAEAKGGRASQQPPTVRVSTRDAGNQVQLRVRDDGTGISDEVRDSVFEPFFTTKGKAGGMGLGLAFIRQLVGSLGGTIDFTTEVGSFTEFVVTLPRGWSFEV